ncbi:MAG TPA: cobalamin-dependent protein [Anaerovoracaceae bacterium]|nr:cobalamin-dependent protein [Anaerovoracaceae bacterium]
MHWSERLLLSAKISIMEADEDRAMELLDEAVSKEMDLSELLRFGFGAGNTEVGNHFELGRLTLPELLYSSEVMKAVTEKVMYLLESGPISQGKIVIATVEGDVHDIGKNIVVSTMRAAGFEVVDLGREVPIGEIVEAAEANQADIIGTSALLTTTLKEQRKLENMLRDLGVRDKYITMVGGAPCTPRWTKRIGADIYSEDAMEAVASAKKAIKAKHQK